MTFVGFTRISSPFTMNYSNTSASVVQGYINSVLRPILSAVHLTDRQRELVEADVMMRLESVLSHWHELEFRRTMLLLGTEEGSFWDLPPASLDVRALVVVAVRNSLIEDLHASHPSIDALRLETRLPEEGVALITMEAIKYFKVCNLDSLTIQPRNDIFGRLPRRFPNAWHALSVLANSPAVETAYTLPMTVAEPVDLSAARGSRPNLNNTVVVSGIDSTLDGRLAENLRRIEKSWFPRLRPFYSYAFKGITRNPEKLLAIIDHVLRHRGTVMTPNYFLSPAFVARRDPLLRPAHRAPGAVAQITNPSGLTARHKRALALAPRE